MTANFNLVPLPQPEHRQNTANRLFAAQLAIENWYVMYIRKDKFNIPEGMSKTYFRETLLNCRISINGVTPEEALARTEEFLALICAANRK